MLTAFHPARTYEYTSNSARSYLIGGGVVYLVLFIYGLVIEHNSANFVPVDDADNRLHLGSQSP